MTRENVYSQIWALFSPLIGSGKTYLSGSRQLKHVDDVDLSDMPALFQNQVTEKPWNQTFAGGVGTIIELELYVYAPSDEDNENTVPSTTLNPCIDAITALFPAPTRTTPFSIVEAGVGYASDLTLGTVNYFEGLLGKKSVAKLQIFVRVPFSF